MKDAQTGLLITDQPQECEIMSIFLNTKDPIVFLFIQENCACHYYHTFVALLIIITSTHWVFPVSSESGHTTRYSCTKNRTTSLGGHDK